MKADDIPLLPGGREIQSAYMRIGSLINQTPVMTSATVNEQTGSTVFFKCENFQKGGAFKFRGATNAILKLGKEELARGVCTHSSGNHAQALALAAIKNYTKAYIVMPENAPLVKVNAVRDYGGQITFCEPTLQAREATLEKVRQETGATFIHPYNNLDVIEGQATCFYEMLGQLSFFPDYVIAPVGGGGLLSGTLLTANEFSPSTKVIAAEPLNANDAWQSFKQKEFVPSMQPNTIADGLKTSLGTYTWPVIRDNLNDIFTVSEEKIVETMFFVWERMKIVIEPSAAVSLAVVLENREIFKDKKIAVIFSGGNTDLKNLPW